MTIVYVLRLEHNKYYIDRTGQNPQEEFQKHLLNNNVYDWTYRFKPIEIIEIFENIEEVDEDFENKITKKYMNEYGIHNVRGGSYRSYQLSNFQMKTLKMELCSSKDFKCLYVGSWPDKCGMVDMFGIRIELSHDYIWLCNYCNEKFPTKISTQNHQCVNLKK